MNITPVPYIVITIQGHDEATLRRHRVYATDAVRAAQRAMRDLEDETGDFGAYDARVVSSAPASGHVFDGEGPRE
jgi:hypothetical protein